MKFDVFLSHNSLDKPAVRTLGTALKQRGLSVWLDEWELRPGLPWQEALEDIVGGCKAATVCFGGSGVGPWEEPEMQALLRRFVKDKKVGNIVPIIPVLLPGAPPNVKVPLFLEAFTWVDLRRGLTADSLEQLRWGITGNKPRENAPTVCLAKVTPDLRKLRETVANYLASARLNVLPTKPYAADTAKFLPALEADLDQADVFVQVLGATYSDRTEEVPEGEEIAQLERAQQRNKVILQWRAKSVDVEAIDDPVHQKLVGGADVVCNDLTEFAKLVAERAQRVHEVGRPAAATGQQWSAVIKADRADDVVADEVCDALESANFDCFVPLTDKPLMEWLREHPDCQAVVIVCGDCSAQWLEKHGEELKIVDINLKDRAPVRAYYISGENVRLPFRNKNLLRVKRRDPESWQLLLTAIQQRGGKL